MLVLAVVALTVARLIERSRLGYGFATIRDDEMAAEATGVPTLRLKLIATMISGASWAWPARRYPYYIGYVEPSATFGLPYAVNSIAMPMIGGTTSWVGPLIGAILLGSLQQIATVTISSAVNLLIVGVLLVAFVIIAPNGIVGLVHRLAARAREQAHDRPPLLEVKGVGKRFGGFVALDGIDLDVQPGERLGLIGPNGSGKSTLVNCVCGTLHNETGSVHFAGQPLDGMAAHQRTHLGLARSFQLPRPFMSLTVVDNLRIPAALHRAPAVLADQLPAGARRSLHRAVAPGRSRRQGAAHAERPHASRDAQARARPRHGRRAEAADRRRGHGRAVAFRDRGHHRPAAAPQRSRASPSS